MKKLVLLLIALLALCVFVSCEDNEDTPAKTYVVGDKGPAGGIIFYDCDADNGNEENDGLESSVCGWRYLEAAPANLRVVGGTPTVDSSLDGYNDAPIGYKFGYYRTTDDGPELYVNGTTTYDTTPVTGQEIGTGKQNTELLLNAMKDKAYMYIHTDSENSETTNEYAAKLCDNLTYNGYSDWFIPSIIELIAMYENLHKEEIDIFDTTINYWSSTEAEPDDYGSFAEAVYTVHFGTGEPFANYRGLSSIDTSNENMIRPIRAF